MTDEPTLTRLAKTTFPEAWEDGRYLGDERAEQQAEQASAIRHTRAVLEAIREPSEAMERAGTGTLDGIGTDFTAGIVWEAMIDAALAETPA